MNPHDTPLSKGSLASIKGLSQLLKAQGLSSTISGPPGGDPNA
ncbi:MAG: hypothetical protein ACI8QZ_001986 [Chlamydiales bacterium]|jgi:hypothetical protein